jgi:PAS domain S-box-containing protein
MTQKKSSRRQMDRSSHPKVDDYRGLFKLSNDVMWIHDIRGNISDGNQAFKELLGQPIKELRGQSIGRFLSGDDRTRGAVVEKDLLCGVTSVGRYEQRVLKHNGEFAALEVATRLITQRDGTVAFQSIGHDITEKKNMEESLRFYIRRVLDTQEEERKSISRDLHDETVQSLVFIIHRLDAMVLDLTDRLPASALAEFNTLRGLIEDTVMDLRRRVQELRPEILEDLGLPSSLEWLADRLTDIGGIHVGVIIDNDIPELLYIYQLTLFRIAQEALANVRKHSRASRARITLEIIPSAVRLTVTDNGLGFPLPSSLGEMAGRSHFGLLGMQERARLLGGTLTIRSVLGQGTTIVAEVPL